MTGKKLANQLSYLLLTSDDGIKVQLSYLDVDPFYPDETYEAVEEPPHYMDIPVHALIEDDKIVIRTYSERAWNIQQNS